jgi:hypothetical protein
MIRSSGAVLGPSRASWQVIPVRPEEIVHLVDYVPHNPSHFCSDGFHYATMDALVQLSNPPVTQAMAWSVFGQVLPIVQPMGMMEGITLSSELL